MKKIYKDLSVLTHAYAEILTELIMTTLLSKDSFNWALSGGNTPKVLFEVLATEYKTKIPWKKVHVYWGDERCVEPDHEESNYYQASKELLCRVAIPRANIHRMKGEEDPALECIRYATVLKNNLPHEHGWPVFDLIHLGLGPDGHTASIFPGQESLLTSEKWCEVGIHPESKQNRITLTGKVINQAQNVHFIVSGESKASVVKEILEETKEYPASGIQPVGELIWFLDEAASAV